MDTHNTPSELYNDFDCKLIFNIILLFGFYSKFCTSFLIACLAELYAAPGISNICCIKDLS